MQVETHDPTTQATIETIDRFNEAFNRHDVDAIMALMTDDVVFDSTSPAPDGKRFEGQEAVRRVWESLFRASPDSHFEGEEIFATGDRCVVRWRYSFGAGHVRGVDIMRVRDGKVSEKFSYVKG
jgi:ketosteroid isomerase-like protein